jgi:hypothetical protein
MLEPHTEADPVAILIQALVATGNLFGRTAHWVVESDKHYCVLNCVLVGDTARARKGVSWRRVKSVLEDVDSTWPQPASGLSSGEGLIYAVRDASRGPRGKVDRGVTDKRLLVVEEEFVRPLVCAKREGNILSAVVRAAFDTGDLRNLTRNSPDKATGAHISIIGHVTRQELLRHLDQTDYANGYANRILWPCVRRSKELPDGGQSHALDFSRVDSQLQAALKFCDPPPELRRDPEAAELWHSEYSRLSGSGPGLIGAVLSRGDAYVMRIATVYAVLDCSNLIKPCHLQAALAVWKYCEDSAHFIFGDILGDPEADTILAALKQAGANGLNRTQISELFARNKSSAQIERALVFLHTNGRVEQRITPSGGGRRIETWFAK